MLALLDRAELAGPELVERKVVIGQLIDRLELHLRLERMEVVLDGHALSSARLPVQLQLDLITRFLANYRGIVIIAVQVIIFVQISESLSVFSLHVLEEGVERVHRLILVVIIEHDSCNFSIFWLIRPVHRLEFVGGVAADTHFARSILSTKD